MTLPQAAETAPSGEECAAAVCSEHHVLRVMLTALRPTDAGGCLRRRPSQEWCSGSHVSSCVIVCQHISFCAVGAQRGVK